MDISFFQRTTCRLCDSKDLVLGSSLAATPPGEAYTTSPTDLKRCVTIPLDLYLCSNCGNIQLGHVINTKQWYGHFYSRRAYSIEMPDFFPRTEGHEAGCRGPKEHTILIESHDRKEDVFWNPMNVGKLREQDGGDSNITAINVIANVDDLKEIINGVRMLIGQEGTFTFETGYGLDLLEKNLIDVVHHDHLSYFTFGALQRFFYRNSLKITEVSRILAKGGTIRCVVRSQSSSVSVSASVNELLSSEAQKLSQGVKLFEKLNKFIKESREQLAKVLDQISCDKKRVAGFGASVGSTTLIYTLGLGERLECLFDDNPRRFNLFTPGHSIPVYSSNNLYERRPDYILILAWRYAQAIMQQHTRYKELGGHFITFLPEIRMY